jgi:hypothetical protein
MPFQHLDCSCFLCARQAQGVGYFVIVHLYFCHIIVPIDALNRNICLWSSQVNTHQTLLEISATKVPHLLV